MSARVVRCRKGDPCRFIATVKTGVDVRYTRARFQVREDWDDSSTLLLSVDETNGITITPGTPGTVEVVIGATATDALPTSPQPRQVAAQLRLYNDADANDRMSWPIPFELQPDVIDDA